MTQENSFVVKFDYNSAVLNKLVDELSVVDESNIEEVDEARKKLVKIRTSITKQGKSFRDEANAYNKKVLAEEKEYLGIIAPLEEKFKKIVDDEKQKQIIEARKELLPMKRKQLDSLPHGLKATDEEILAMDDEQWVKFFQDSMDVNQKELDRIEQEKKDAKERKAREKQIAEEAAEKAKKEAEEKAEADKKAEEDRKERQAQEEADKQAKLEADKKYQQFLKDNNFDESTDIIKRTDSEVKIYRLVDTLEV